jgi:hypothetical protein
MTDEVIGIGIGAMIVEGPVHQAIEAPDHLDETVKSIHIQPVEITGSANGRIDIPAENAVVEARGNGTEIEALQGVMHDETTTIGRREETGTCSMTVGAVEDGEVNGEIETPSVVAIGKRVPLHRLKRRNLHQI